MEWIKLIIVGYIGFFAGLFFAFLFLNKYRVRYNLLTERTAEVLKENIMLRKELNKWFPEGV